MSAFCQLANRTSIPVVTLFFFFSTVVPASTLFYQVCFLSHDLLLNEITILFHYCWFLFCLFVFFLLLLSLFFFSIFLSYNLNN